MSLIERLEAAEVGSRELDCLVLECVAQEESDGSKWRALKWDDHWFFALFAKGVEPCPNEWLVISQEERVTTSLDAALALAERVLPGWFWEIQICPYATTVQGALESWNEGLAAPDVGGIYADARTPALALCCAILKTKETK